MKPLLENWRKYLTEADQAPHLNKWDPGSLLARIIWILENESKRLENQDLQKAADSVREASRVVSEAWMSRNRPVAAEGLEKEADDETPT
jgi:hypothetical protein